MHVAALEDVPADAGSYGQTYGQSASGGWRQLEDNAQWTGPSTLECASMEGRRAVIDVEHYPTALQVCFRALLRAYWGGPVISLTLNMCHHEAVPLLHRRVCVCAKATQQQAFMPGSSPHCLSFPSVLSSRRKYSRTCWIDGSHVE